MGAMTGATTSWGVFGAEKVLKKLMGFRPDGLSSTGVVCIEPKKDESKKAVLGAGAASAEGTGSGINWNRLLFCPPPTFISGEGA